jgi:hypothetical protein
MGADETMSKTGMEKVLMRFEGFTGYLSTLPVVPAARERYKP